MKPPPLKNDCFAMPPGVDWTPVDDALSQLRSGLTAIVRTETVSLHKAADRVLSKDVVAARSNPPFANSAVDGFGFKLGDYDPDQVVKMPLEQGRSAAGVPFTGVVTKGRALRILTGAQIPSGVDTVVLEEDCSVTDTHVAFRAGLRRGANTRAVGEDVEKGAELFSKGRKLGAADLALLSACGVHQLDVFAPLRVGILSTGDELVQAGEITETGRIYDANRPMLLEMIRKWGFLGVDLGLVNDEAKAVRRVLSKGAKTADVILTSGGVSAGDEDHVSRLLRVEGTLNTWRVAVKPGRPLAMALWDGVPVFGLPGNPVAAMVCALIFALPALKALAGQDWQHPIGYELPAGFKKDKKAGRREYLRAKYEQGQVKLFKSEGSGRISGLSWAHGLVELPDEAVSVRPGDMIKYIPFGSFGI